MDGAGYAHAAERMYMHLFKAHSNLFFLRSKLVIAMRQAPSYTGKMMAFTGNARVTVIPRPHGILAKVNMARSPPRPGSTTARFIRKPLIMCQTSLMNLLRRTVVTVRSSPSPQLSTTIKNGGFPPRGKFVEFVPPLTFYARSMHYIQ